MDLVKLILADNLIRELSEEIQHLPALTVLDVRGVWCGECMCVWVGRRGWCVEDFSWACSFMYIGYNNYIIIVFAVGILTDEYSEWAVLLYSD